MTADREAPRGNADLLAAVRHAARQEQFLEVVAPDEARRRFESAIDLSPLPAETVGFADALGRVQEVRGAGVVGEEPVLKSGESFEYTSGVPLPTPSGFMVGTYGMVSESGEHFDINIPAFSLDCSYAERTIN